MLVHVISLENEDIVKAYKTVRKELKQYDEKLLEKKEIIVLTKTDLIDNFDIREAKKKFKDIHSNIYAISLYDDDDMKSFGEALIKEFTLINE